MEKTLTYEEKINQVQKLPHDAFWVIAVLAVAGKPIKVDKVANILNHMGIKPDHFVKYSSQQVYNHIDQLRELDMTYPIGPKESIHAEWKEVAARCFFNAKPRYRPVLADALRHELRISKYDYSLYWIRVNDIEDLITDLRIRLFAGKAEAFRNLLAGVLRIIRDEDTLHQILAEVNAFFSPFDEAFLNALSPKVQVLVLRTLLINQQVEEPLPIDSMLSYIQSQPITLEDHGFRFRDVLFMLLMQQGKTEQTEALNHKITVFPEWKGLQLWQAMTTGDWESATALAKTYPLQRIRTDSSFLDCMQAFRWLFELRQHEFSNAEAIRVHLYQVEREGTTLAEIFHAVKALLTYHLETADSSMSQLKEVLEGAEQPIELLMGLWVSFWIGYFPEQEIVEKGMHHLQIAKVNAHDWLTGEFSHTLASLAPDHPKAEDWKRQAVELADQHGYQYYSDLMPRLEVWERVLNNLERITKTNKPKPTPGEKRLVYQIDFDREEILIKEQKIAKRGGWTSGRKVSIKALLAEEVDSMTAQDRQILDAIETHGSNWYAHRNQPKLNFKRAMLALIDHPHLFLDGRQAISFDLLKGAPEMLISEVSQGLQVQFVPTNADTGINIVKETPTRYRVYQLTDNQATIAQALGSGVIIPDEARPQIEALVPDLKTKVPVQSTLDISKEDLPIVEADSRPCIHLLPYGEGFQLEFYIKPIPDEVYYFKPGEGLSRKILETTKGKIICNRFLHAEEQAAEAVISKCPTLANTKHFQYEWQFDHPEECLQVLLELHPLRTEKAVTLEHPKGEKLKIVGIGTAQDLSMRIHKERDWFEVDGTLAVNEQEVLQFRNLLQHVQASDSPFVQLEEGTFLALTDAFRKQLLELDGMLKQKGNDFQLSSLMVPQLDAFKEQLAHVEVDAAWQETLSRIHKAQNIRPSVPKGLQADLRAYQKDGFRWLLRLAEWGVGACLADDMGLGKTVQALAMLLSRKEKGPALVIAPASVTRNWISETRRFTPGLKPILIGSSKEVELLQKLSPGDLVMVSYGLLPFIKEELQEVIWSTVILDEAQAIKNHATKRSKAVMNLQADFRVATTGTPIENHLGELWNLFRFLNPGLLGSRQQFADKFAKPIANGDKARQEQLRNMVRPFILRRRKHEVLTELPPKTEVVLNVELSDRERDFYEALRRDALTAIGKANDTSKRFTVLAQLTKLRQAASHPRLVQPNSYIPSAKLQLVGETILELLENGHKALVFSQFVKHLKIVEQWVQSEGIAYQYLDGSTPSSRRQERIEAFQNGSGELFLISLKAGGTGLNLTAADYVLHLDPWWNPAVEDQASDRAHRIGQMRPVTVYRFVSEQTIEEKIVALHEEKRALADQLLSGTEASASLSVDEMLNLIKG